MQVKASKEDVSTIKRRNNLLERDIKLAKDELDNYTSNMSNRRYWYGDTIHSFIIEKKARDIEDLQSRLDNCEKEQQEVLNKSKEVKVQKECESPCTISRNEKNDLIALSDVENKNEKLKIENEKLSTDVENLKISLDKCENPEPTVSKKASETIIKELLS